MALAESLLRLLVGERHRLSRLGLPSRPMMRTLQGAIDAYRQAEAAGDPRAMSEAQDEVDRLLKEHLLRVLAAVAEPPPWDRLS